MSTSRVSTSSTARWICETLVTSSVRGVTRLSVLCSALRAPAYKRLIDQRPTDAAVGAGDQYRLLLKFHFVLLSELSVSNWYYASPPGQDTWAKPNNCVETLT